MKKRLEELEVRIAFQDKTIQELNDVVTRQQRELDRLTQQLEALKVQVRAAAPPLVVSREEETPPPHY
jgi:SlyX protein